MLQGAGAGVEWGGVGWGGVAWCCLCFERQQGAAYIAAVTLAADAGNCPPGAPLLLGFLHPTGHSSFGRPVGCRNLSSSGVPGREVV
jgi:hypothetical protein